MTVPDDVTRLLAERFGLESGDPITVSRDRVVELGGALKEAGFTYLVYVACAHYPATDAEPDRTVAEYRVRRLPVDEVAFRVWVPTGESTPTLVPVFAGCDWQEREQFDLVGTIFAGHPDLRRIMLPEDWEGHPLRRDYDIATRHHPWR
ncbi:hypothetical protein LBMAG42_31830 [Deltaproteobacteria bacterium]|nr:hypothetical protein LBMAG42_31830 [Deltaproteobacteria bacterium]